MDSRSAIDKKYKLIKAKAYFERGYGLTHYIKYLIAFFGLASRNTEAVMTIGMVYIPACFCLGWWWYNHGWAIREQEVNNEFNLFVKEMREKLK